MALLPRRSFLALLALNFCFFLALLNRMHRPLPARRGAVPNAARFPFPKVLHQMHASRERLSPLELLLAQRCEAVNGDFEYRFWNDALIDAFVASRFPEHHAWWSAMTPVIKKVDTTRYMLMLAYGGAYADLDVDCLRPISAVASHLPSGTAWLGGYPEPFQLMSDSGNQFWLFMLERIRSSLDNSDAWTSTGPSGLNDAAKAYVELHGKGVLMPWVTRDTEPGWLEFLGDNNMSVPWFVENFKLRNDTRRDGGGVGFGFWPNQVVDPGACAGSKTCANESCREQWPHALYAHRCLGSWRT
jgi:hypothetical protein